MGFEYNTIVYRHEDGYHFNCDAPTSCPFTKMRFFEFHHERDNSSDNGEDGHLCSFDQRLYHEISLVTNICIDLIDEYGLSVMVDCDAQSVRYVEYSDAECTQQTTPDEEVFVVREGCDDVFDIDAYIQIAECDDAQYDPDTGDDDGDAQPKELGLIFTALIGVVVVVLAIMICIGMLRKRNRGQIDAANVDAQPFNVDFQSIADVPASEVHASPDTTQQITAGHDV